MRDFLTLLLKRNVEKGMSEKGHKAVTITITHYGRTYIQSVLASLAHFSPFKRYSAPGE
jgi:hypothetical protein